MSKIIGHGTWYDKAAEELIEHDRSLGRSLDLIRTESGLGASGFPHIGSLGDAIRNYAIALGVQSQGFNSELIAFSDDKDGLRKVPIGLPEELEKWLGFSVSAIPDPFGNCHENFGSHMTSLLLEALDVCGAKYTFKSGTKIYEKGILNQEIITLMEKAEKVGEIIKEEIGQDKYLEALPYFPVCEECGRIYTTNSYSYLSDEHKVLYRCAGMEVKGRWLKGCGHTGEIDVLSGHGKLSWKVEFAARWKALDIRFEAYGKDIADSVRVNDRICKEILDHDPPMHVQYEMFLDRGGKKISKSAGNVFTPQIWFKYGSPQSLNLLILKRFVGAKSGSVDEIPTHMDELDDLEEIYFGKVTLGDKRDQAKLSGLYNYCWMLKPPKEPKVHIPYNLLINLANMAPKGTEIEFLRSKIEGYGYLKDGDKGLSPRILYALNWVRDFGEAEGEPAKLSESEARAIRILTEVLKNTHNEEGYQSSVFEVARMEKIKPRRLFQVLYMSLIGKTRGPRFGPYVAVMGKEKVINVLERSLRKS